MTIKKTKSLQNERLRELCNNESIDFKNIISLLDSTRTKKLLKRNNYHQQKINDIIEKEIK